MKGWISYPDGAAVALCKRVMQMVDAAALDRKVPVDRLVSAIEDFGGLNALLDWTLACGCHLKTGRSPNEDLAFRQSDLDGALRLAEAGERRRNTVVAGSVEDLARM